MGYNCTVEQNALIDQCAAPINELTSRIDELFEVRESFDFILYQYI